jgi:anti-anti-sigma factor
VETTVRPSGRIAASTSAALERTISGLIPQFSRVVLDVSNVDHIDHSGVGVLAKVYLQARTAGCDLEIANPKPPLRAGLRRWLRSVFEGHHEFLGLTPD